VHAFHVPAGEGAVTIAHFHGNGESLADQAALGDWFHARGLGFYAVEYPGYGLSSDASPSERAIYEDAEAALVHLRDVLHVANDRIVLEGQSLGTGVVVEMARRGFGARLVLISPYTSMVDMANRLLPFLPTGLLVTDRYDTERKAPSIRLPTLIVHGTIDEVVPVEMGRRLATVFPSVALREVPAAHHNDIWLVDRGLVAAVADFAMGAVARRAAP
jgi:pimeloyl-ACP methyl ester carboxylesterase